MEPYLQALSFEVMTSHYHYADRLSSTPTLFLMVGALPVAQPQACIVHVVTPTSIIAAIQQRGISNSRLLEDFGFLA